MDDRKNPKRRIMKTSSYQIRLCENPDCGLRYPLIESSTFGERCPSCLGQTQIVFSTSNTGESPTAKIVSPLPVEGLLDNIRSGWNVGAMFRTSEGFGLRRVHLCGITPTPSSADISKTALGAESSVPWTYHPNSITAAEALKNKGYILWALEYNSGAESIYNVNSNIENFQFSKGLIIIAGNEETGVDPDLVQLCHKTIYIPMKGVKQSFNVSVAYGIALGIINSNFWRP
jgi:23S rRNA (guanosine2251-2'-O)-methyltransferase